MKFLFTILTCLIVSKVALGNFIIGGQVVSATDPIAASTVQIQTDGLLEVDCTAIILNSRILLTAAHCIAKNVSAIEVYFQINNKGLNKPPVISKRFIIHPGYKDSDDPDKNDLALILLNQPIPSKYTPTRLLPKNIQIAVGGKTFVAGYGEDAIDNFSSFGTLRRTSLSVVGTSGKTEIILDHGVCHGDSGGPAYLRVNSTNFVWGIASRQLDSEDCKSRVIYTKISSQMDFIRKATAELLNSSSTGK